MKPPPTEENKNVGMMEALQWTTLLPELRREVLRNLNEDDLGELSMVSRQCRDECRDSSLSQRRTATISCRPPNAFGNCFGHSLHPLAKALMKVPSKPVFRERFTHFKVEGCRLPKINAREAKPITKSVALSHVTHLDLSSSSAVIGDLPQIAPSITKLMTQLVPEVQSLDLSYNQVGTAALADASRNCKKLEALSIVGGALASSITGIGLKQCGVLKELYLDNTRVSCSDKEETDLEDADQEDACPLRYCLWKLERVSLKGCSYYNPKDKQQQQQQQRKPLTQLAMMKFVRNANKLQWFDSDLTAENAKLLKEERPDVVFVGHDE